ncbi:MAG: transglycosylase domain-containing protein, partial [Bacteroidetes bacterium]|nr:transglycosylase domain-containing protein [Bacteroidota bacterium]
MSNKKKKKRNKGKRRLLIAFILIILFTAFGYYIYGGLPSLEQLENPKPQLASTVYSIDGEQLGKYFIENRIEKHFSEFPAYLIKALISTEDRKFYNHWGVDIVRFGKAMVKNILTFSREGASTITQQLAKNLYKLKLRKENVAQTIVRKIREWITAIQIEKTYTKNEILELYLNVSYFGKGAYGIESASRIYFNKSVNELSLPEAALFVALLKSSSHYNPVRHPVEALLRRNLVMRSMVVMGELSEADYRKLKKEPIILAENRIKGSKSIAPYFMEYVRKKLSALSSKYKYDLYRDGLNIYTTIDSRM